MGVLPLSLHIWAIKETRTLTLSYHKRTLYRLSYNRHGDPSPVSFPGSGLSVPRASSRPPFSLPPAWGLPLGFRGHRLGPYGLVHPIPRALSASVRPHSSRLPPFSRGLPPRPRPIASSDPFSSVSHLLVFSSPVDLHAYASGFLVLGNRLPSIKAKPASFVFAVVCTDLYLPPAWDPVDPATKGK